MKTVHENVTILTTEDVIERFSTFEAQPGYKDFIAVDDIAVNSTEWGVDVIVLTEGGDANHVVAYRSSNPMLDGEWRVGKLDDVAEELEMVADSWLEFRYRN